MKHDNILKGPTVCSDRLHPNTLLSGSITLKEGVVMGCFKADRLVKEQGLTTKQPGPHAYKVANVERPDIPNKPNREFNVEAPNRICCGDITYI